MVSMLQTQCCAASTATFAQAIFHATAWFPVPISTESNGWGRGCPPCPASRTDFPWQCPCGGNAPLPHPGGAMAFPSSPKRSSTRPRMNAQIFAKVCRGHRFSPAAGYRLRFKHDGKPACAAVYFIDAALTGSLLDAFISFNERLDRMLVTPGSRLRVLSMKPL